MLYYGSKLSDNIRRREPEGYLYCLNVPIARIGKQPYLKRELGLDGEGVVQVIRTPEEVFSREAIASFESMPVCDDHPFADVDANNITAYGKGHVQNVRRGKPPEDDLLFADLIITHKDLIDEVLSGKREVSCGYNCNYELGDDGNVYQRAIRGNHVAVVDNGRAGSRVAIRDAMPEIKERRNAPMPNYEKKPSLLARAVAKFVRDSEPEEGAQAIDDMLETGDAFPGMPEKEPEQMDAAPFAQAAPAPQAAPAIPQQDAPVAPADPMQEILATLRELKAALVKPKAGPLDALEKELAAPAAPAAPKPAPMAPAAPKPAVPQAGGQVVPAEKLHDEEPEEITEDAEEFEEEEEVTDADVVEEEEETETTDACGTKDTYAALLSVVKDMKKDVAGLPNPYRTRISDSMSNAVRKAAGLTPEARAEGAKKLARIAAGKKAKDSAPEVDDRDLGRSLMAKYNPHYKK